MIGADIPNIKIISNGFSPVNKLLIAASLAVESIP